MGEIISDIESQGQPPINESFVDVITLITDAASTTYRFFNVVYQRIMSMIQSGVSAQEIVSFINDTKLQVESMFLDPSQLAESRLYESVIKDLLEVAAKKQSKRIQVSRKQLQKLLRKQLK